MTMGGVVSSLSSTLARLSAIERNFQALNSVALEFNYSQPKAENVQNSDFQAILDGKIEDKKDISQNSEVLPVYDDEIMTETELEPQKNKIEALEEVKNNNISSAQEEFTPLKEEDIEELLEHIIPNNDIKSEPVQLKSKILNTRKTASIDEIIETLSKKYDVDSNFVKALIKQESGFNPNATSKKGAMGLMQLMPKTAQSLGVSDAYNPWQNVEGGIKHLKGLLEKYNNNHELALAAYNAGSGAVQKYGGIPPYKETQNYVKSIMSAYSKTKEAKI